MNYIALFFTHSGAVKFDKTLRNKGIKTLMMPSPRVLSSNCGISVQFTYDSDIQSLINEDVESIYKIQDVGTKNYMLVYSD